MIKLFSDDKYDTFAQALMNVSGAKTWGDREDSELIYKFLEETPKASLVVELVDEIERVKRKEAVVLLAKGTIDPDGNLIYEDLTKNI